MGKDSMKQGNSETGKQVKEYKESEKMSFSLPSSMMAVVTFLPVTPCAQAASTLRSRRALPPFCPVLRRYHWKGK